MRAERHSARRWQARGSLGAHTHNPAGKCIEHKLLKFQKASTRRAAAPIAAKFCCRRAAVGPSFLAGFPACCLSVTQQAVCCLTDRDCLCLLTPRRLCRLHRRTFASGAFGCGLGRTAPLVVHLSRAYRLWLHRSSLPGRTCCLSVTQQTSLSSHASSPLPPSPPHLCFRWCLRLRTRSYGAACCSSLALTGSGSIAPPSQAALAVSPLRSKRLSVSSPHHLRRLHLGALVQAPSAADSVARRRPFFLSCAFHPGAVAPSLTARPDRPKRRTPIAHPRHASRGRPIA